MLSKTRAECANPPFFGPIGRARLFQARMGIKEPGKLHVRRGMRWHIKKENTYFKYDILSLRGLR